MPETAPKSRQGSGRDAQVFFLIGGPGLCTQGGRVTAEEGEAARGGPQPAANRSSLHMGGGPHTKGAGPQMPRDSFHPRLHNLAAAAKV